MIKLQKYLNVRYVLASEACWWLFNFGLQERSHKVEWLPVHLPNQQYVIFQEGEDMSTVLEKFSDTKLTCYFETCANNPNLNLRYIDFPKAYVWENGNW